MKPILLKSHDRFIHKFALVGIFSALLAACEDQGTADPKSHDIYKPRITLNSPGATAIVKPDSGSELEIPHEDICFEISDDCSDITSMSSGMIHYTELENELTVFKSVKGTITAYREEHKYGTDYNDPSATARDVYDGHIEVETHIDGPVQGSSKSELTIIPVGTVLGSYTFTYSATDSSNNVATLNRIVDVVDMDPPVISLNGDSSLVLDFYSGIILKAIGIPTSMFTVIFAMARTVGWIAHWHEMHSGPYRIGRPRQLYTGETARDYPKK
jgi:hypothetical protein